MSLRRPVRQRGKAELALKYRVISPRQLDQDRVSGGIQPANQSDEILFRHRRASGGWRSRIFPDVEKDQRPGAGTGSGIMIDYNAPLIKMVVPPHLFRTAPIHTRHLCPIDQPVVITRTRIINALDVFRERQIAQLHPGGGLRGRISKHRAQPEDARGDFVVAFNLARPRSGICVHQAATPSETFFPKDDRDLRPAHSPGTAGVAPLESAEHSGRRIPISRYDNNTLPSAVERIRRSPSSCRRSNERKHEEWKPARSHRDELRPRLLALKGNCDERLLHHLPPSRKRTNERLR